MTACARLRSIAASVALVTLVTLSGAPAPADPAAPRPATAKPAATEPAGKAATAGASAKGGVQVTAMHAVAGSQAPAVKLGPEEQALREIDETCHQQVAALALRLQGLEDGPALHQIQRQIVDLKLAARMQSLATQARFARARGDQVTALECERAANLLLHPERAATPASAAAAEKPAPGDVRRP
jgi:hypothetical protein